MYPKRLRNKIYIVRALSDIPSIIDAITLAFARNVFANT